MRNIFKRKKKDQSPENEKLPLEQTVVLSLNRLLNIEGELQPSDLPVLEEFLSREGGIRIFQLCGNSDRFPFSVVMGLPGPETDGLVHLLGELSAMEVIHHICSFENKGAFLWRNSDSTVLRPAHGEYLILIDGSADNEPGSDCLHITRNREFFFGRHLTGDFSINNSPLLFTTDKICFSAVNEPEEDFTPFNAQFSLDDRNFSATLAIKGQGPVINLMAKETISRMKQQLGIYPGGNIKILSAGPQPVEDRDYLKDFRIEGSIFTTGGTFPWRMYFSRKLLNIFPEQQCTTIKGKILQTDRLLFEKNFSTFHKTGEVYLMADFLTHLNQRDLNLVCQNFFLSRGYRGNNLTTLFRYRVKLEEKSRVLRIPFTGETAMISRLPQGIREEYRISREYASSLEELIDMNRTILREIYRDFHEGKLLLSPNAALLLERETGREMKENKMLRLKKLMSDGRYLNALTRMDGSRAQVLLGAMNHTWLTDTFVYQTEKLPVVKPFLSKNRFRELMEDVAYTQKKIKSGQIDINRIGDSMENFYREVRLFMEKEKKRLSRKA